MLTCYLSLNPHHGLFLDWPWPTANPNPFLVPATHFLPIIQTPRELSHHWVLHTLPHSYLPFGYSMSTHFSDCKHDLHPHVFVWSSDWSRFPNSGLVRSHRTWWSYSFELICVIFSQHWESLSIRSVHSKRGWFCCMLLGAVLRLELTTARSYQRILSNECLRKINKLWIK